MKYAERLKAYVEDTGVLLDESIKTGAKILLKEPRELTLI